MEEETHANNVSLEEAEDKSVMGKGEDEDRVVLTKQEYQDLLTHHQEKAEDKANATISHCHVAGVAGNMTFINSNYTTYVGTGWILDTGETHYISHNIDLFESHSKISYHS